MTHRDLVVVGASAGGVEALREFVGALPTDLPAAVLVVLHLPSAGPSVLASVLSRRSPLPVQTAHDGAPLTEGVVLVAPPDRHLVAGGDTVAVTAGPEEHGHRPAVDVLFRSAARSRGPRVVAVVLSGTLDDGTAGATEVRAAGGLVAVQDPSDALYGAMPSAAAARAGADAVASAATLAEVVASWCREPVEETTSIGPGSVEASTNLGQGPDPVDLPHESRGEPSGLTCPECQGALFTVGDTDLLRLRCRVGHAWSADSLAARQQGAVERALWAAARALDERADFCDRLADRARHEGGQPDVGRLRRLADEARTFSSVVTGFLATATRAEGETVDGPGPRDIGGVS